MSVCKCAPIGAVRGWRRKGAACFFPTEQPEQVIFGGVRSSEGGMPSTNLCLAM